MTKIVNYLTNSLTGIEGEPGIAYSYILAENGLFLRAKNAHLAATVCIAPTLVRGLAPLQEEIQLLHGKIPIELLSLALSELCKSPDIEKYLAIIWDNGYTIRIPSQEGTAGRVNYEIPDNRVMDIHSHTGSMPAQFSGIDNHDEQSFCIYAVVGELTSLFPNVTLRIGLYGYFMEIKKSEVFV